MLNSIIIADALASPLDNSSAEHLRSVFGAIHDYSDPTPALKNKLHMWKKPSSYTAISQYCILVAGINALHTTYNHKAIVDFFSLFGDSSTVLRHPQGFLYNYNSPYDAPTCELLICIPALFFLQHHPTTETVIHFISSHNKNAAIFTASMFLFYLLEEIIKQKLTELPSTLHHITSRVLQDIEQHSSTIFDNGINPALVYEAAKDFHTLFENITLQSNEKEFTSYCLPFVHKWSKNTFTRLTVNHPFALLPLALFIIHSNSNKQSLLFETVHKGGKIALLTPLVALLSACLWGNDVIPAHLRDGIINKKRIAQLIELLHKRQISFTYLTEFFKNEEKLTRKEKEELESKLKHVKIKSKFKNKKPDSYTELSQHVVASWTKVDKAKWKKERKKHKNL